MNADDEILTTDEAIRFTKTGKSSFQKYYRDIGLKIETKNVTYLKSMLLDRWDELKLKFDGFVITVVSDPNDLIMTTNEAIDFTHMGVKSFDQYFRHLGLRLPYGNVTYRRSHLLARWQELKDGDHGRV